MWRALAVTLPFTGVWLTGCGGDKTTITTTVVNSLKVCDFPPNKVAAGTIECELHVTDDCCNSILESNAAGEFEAYPDDMEKYNELMAKDDKFCQGQTDYVKFRSQDENVSSQICKYEDTGANGVIYVVAHAEVSDTPPNGLSAEGLGRAANMVKIFNGSVFKTPASIFAAKLPGKVQLMVDTASPLAKHLDIEMDTSVTLIAKPNWTEEPCKETAKNAMLALKKGPVLIVWWFYIEYLCKDLGQTCPGNITDISDYDQVLVVTVEDGKVKSMEMANENLVDMAVTLV